MRWRDGDEEEKVTVRRVTAKYKWSQEKTVVDNAEKKKAEKRVQMGSK
jgi:hypothetical protein